MARIARFGFKKLDVYRAAVEHYAWAAGIVGRMGRAPFKVTDQVIGAALSIVSNIGEANGREKKPGEVEQHYRYAQGSTFEAASHLDALAAMGVIDDEEYNHREESLARLASMLTGMIRRHNTRRSPLEQRAQRASKQRATRAPEQRATRAPEQRATRASEQRAQRAPIRPT